MSYTHRDVQIEIERDGYTVLRGFASAVRAHSRPQRQRYRRLAEKFNRSELLAIDYYLSFQEPFWDDDFDDILDNDDEVDIIFTFNDDGEITTRTYSSCKVDETSIADGEPSFQRSVSFICQGYQEG